MLLSQPTPRNLGPPGSKIRKPESKPWAVRRARPSKAGVAKAYTPAAFGLRHPHRHFH